MHFAFRLVLVMFFASIHVAAAEDPSRADAFPDTVTPERYTLTFEHRPAPAAIHGPADIRCGQSRHAAHLAARQRTDRVERRYRGRRSPQPAKYQQVDPISGVARLDVASDAARRDRPLSTSPTRAAFAQGAEGFFRAQTGTDWYVFSQMEPIDARRAFPGIRRAALQDPIRDHDHHTGGNKAVSNAPLKSVTTLKDGRIRYEFVAHASAADLPGRDCCRARSISSRPHRSRRMTSARQPLPLRGVATRGQGANSRSRCAKRPNWSGVSNSTSASPTPTRSST